MSRDLRAAQTLRYAEELRELFTRERAERQRAERALDELQQSYSTTVRALAAAVELRDDATGAHAVRVTELALTLAREVASDLAGDPQLEYGFLLHDVGKIGIRDSVLLKPGSLSTEERRHIEEHPSLGEQIVGAIPYLGGVARQVVACHHERWDGTGYPRGLSGEDIPLCARIFALVDTFDAITSDRPYRSARSAAEALAAIEAGAGAQFDPELVGPFAALAGLTWLAA